MEAKPRDFLSYLPDAILHHIFSFLQVRDILKLRILSRRFNKTLCTASPSFCFSDHRPLDDPDPSNCSCTHVYDFMKNTVPQNRPHTLMIINQISLSSFCNKREHRELHEQWIIQLFEAFCVHELSFDYKLPSIFTSLPKFQSLKVLKLNMNQLHTVVKLPKMELASLETLHIKSIETDDLLDEWISQSFPSLKHLFLHQIINWAPKQDFTIQSSCLEDLAIHDFCCFQPVRIITENLRTLSCFICGHVRMHETNFVLKTSARNLQSLTWIGDGADPHRLRDDDEETFENLLVTAIPRLVIMKESNWNLLIELFTAVICSVRELHIDTEVLQQWLRILHNFMAIFEDLHGKKPIFSFEDLRHLEIHVQDYIDGEDYITFLEMLSNLETLTLVSYPIHRSDFNPYLNKPSVRDKFEKALRDCRKVEVRRTKGLKKMKLITGEFNFSIVILIGWLLKSCSDLEEMMLYYPYCFHKSMMQEGVLYLQRFERASPTPPLFHFFPQDLIP